MADLQVTMTASYSTRKSNPPIEKGSGARTERITIGGTSTAGDLTATSAENVVSIYAPVDCYIAIATAPVAENTEPTGQTHVDSRFMAEGERMQFSIDEGEKVAVIAA